jgi:formyltetrahydrofolate deformylase
MRVIITAVGSDNWGLADRIVHYVTSVGAIIAEIQMDDHPAEGIFALMLRCHWPGRPDTLAELRARMEQIERHSGLSIRTWARPEEGRPPRLVLCTTYRPEPALAVLQAIHDGRLRANVVALVGNRPTCRALAEQFGVEWHLIGDERGVPDNDLLVQIIDECEADYVVLARYMRVLPASVCWKLAGRIINLHHGLLPAFPGAQPYRDAFARHMLSYGSTVHFIVPELDAGEQIIYQDAFTVGPGTSLEEIMRTGEREHEPRCLVEGLRRVVHGEVELHFRKVVRRARNKSHATNILPTNAQETERTMCLGEPFPWLGAASSMDTNGAGLEMPIDHWHAPSARRRPDSRRDCQPDRGHTLLSLADVALFLGALAPCLGFPALIALILGVATWAMSCHDQRQMRSGLMDSDGWNTTTTARGRALVGAGLGLFGAILWVCFLAVTR